ncbi:MAG: type II toxin-antitoxin system RelE/ParE family toxin [Acidobacteriota bacterium]
MILDIRNYVADDSPANADRLLDSINKQCRTLARFPKMGRARNELGASLRSFPVGNYVIFYREISKGIEIIRVVHGARDIEGIISSGE